MVDLSFQLLSVTPVEHSASPELLFKLRVSSRAPVRALALQCQLRLEAPRRRYTAVEEEGLKDLFGEPARWGTTLQSLLWTHAATHVPSFEGSTVAELHVPCTFDFNVAATKYFYSLQGGEVPLKLLFSGTVFHAAPDGRLLVAPVPWSSELSASFPATQWKELIARHHPGGAVLRLETAVFDRLYRFKVSHGIPTWEGALERLLSREEAGT